jgi:glutamine synthetase
VNDALERFRGLDGRHLWIAYHDYSGVARAKSVPPERIQDAVERGVTFAMANWDLVITGQLVPEPGFALDSGDFHVIPEARSMVPIPYRSGVVQALGHLLDGHGLAWPGDPRARLAAQVDALASVGLSATVAFEAEFTLVRPQDGRYELADRGRMFTTDEIEARWPLVEAWLDALATMDIPVHQVAKEWGPAQYEISLLPADPISAVERFLFTRQVIRALSRQAGLRASFMPKLFSDVPGNGLHVHIGLIRDGNDAMAGAGDDEISDVGSAAVAGLLRHASAQSALGSPSANSYKRLSPNTAAPAHICWAFGNRAALVRIPGPGHARRLEYRAGDATANVYLLLTGLLAAIVDGVGRAESAPPAADVDVGRLSDREAADAGFARLPADLEAALSAFEADGVMVEAVGPVVAEHYPAVKRFELDLYRQAVDVHAGSGEVSEWEREIYLEHT